MENTDLINFNNQLRELILEHLDEQNITLTEFCRKAKLSQPQMWMFMNTKDPKKGLHTSTLEKIGDAMVWLQTQIINTASGKPGAFFYLYSVVKITYQNGFPTQYSIRTLMKSFGMNHRMFTFSADYGCEKAGILWYKGTTKKDVEKFIEFIKWNGIGIKSIRYGTKICSVWFEKKPE